MPQAPWAKICNLLLARAYHALRYRRLPDFPSSLILETTSRCNLNCRMCPRRDMQRPAQDMPLDLFARLLDQMSEWDARDALDFVALHWFGEPLLHPQLGDMLALAGQRLPNLLKRGALRNPVRGLSLSTNATLLDEPQARMLFDSPLTWLGVSVDGSDPETYEAMRVGGVFEQVVENVTRLLEINRNEPRPFPTVAVQVIVTHTTAPQLSEFVTRWEKLLGGAANARVELKPYTDWAGQVQAAELCTPDRRRGYLHLNCGSLWDTMAIGADGTVGLCCYDVNAQHNLGNAATTSLYDLWHSPELNALRTRMSRGQLADLPLCANCAMGRKYISDYLGRRRRR